VAAVKGFLIGSVALFGMIGGYAYVKKRAVEKPPEGARIVEISLNEPQRLDRNLGIALKEPVYLEATPQPLQPIQEDFPEVDRIYQLFTLDSSKLPLVETVAYTSRVPWLKDRPAWIADYASHYETSRHFIARSLNKKIDYFTQKISPGDRFNVFKRDKQINFHLLIDLSRCRMWFYAMDLEANERILLKTYPVGIGRVDQTKTSGFLTPVGKYLLGNKVAIYKPETLGFFQDNKIEMIRVFGTRWIPFEQEVEGCSEPAKGLGLHGAPWVPDASGQLVEDKSKISKYDSDGCIRLASQDMEEIFSIIITKPTRVELVTDVHQAKLPGIERK